MIIPKDVDTIITEIKTNAIVTIIQVAPNSFRFCTIFSRTIFFISFSPYFFFISRRRNYNRTSNISSYDFKFTFFFFVFHFISPFFDREDLFSFLSRNLQFPSKEFIEELTFVFLPQYFLRIHNHIFIFRSHIICIRFLQNFVPP